MADRTDIILRTPVPQTLAAKVRGLWSRGSHGKTAIDRGRV